MNGTKEFRFKMKDRFDYSWMSLGGKRKYGLLVSIFTDAFGKFFNFEFPCRVKVTTDVCGITEMSLRTDTYEFTFATPRFDSTSYRFDSLSERRFMLNSKGIPYLTHVFTVDNMGFYFSNCYETADGHYKKSPKLSLPYLHESTDIWVELNSPIMYTPAIRLVGRYKETIESVGEFLEKRTVFSFKELLETVASTLEVPISQIKKVDITNFLHYSEGKIYAATSRNEVGDFISFSNDDQLVSYIASNFRVDMSLNTKAITFTPLAEGKLLADAKETLQDMALAEIDRLMREIRGFNFMNKLETSVKE